MAFFKSATLWLNESKPKKYDKLIATDFTITSVQIRWTLENNIQFEVYMKNPILKLTAVCCCLFSIYASEPS